MQIFEYPYIIITILVMAFLLMGIIGLYFTIKSVKTANEADEKGFCTIGRIENEYEKLVSSRNQRSLIYISVSLDNMSRLHSESKSMRIHTHIRKQLFKCFGNDAGGKISLYGKNNFLAINELVGEEIELHIKECLGQIDEILLGYEAVNIAHVRFGYYCSKSTEVPFKTALERAKQACTMAEDKDVMYYGWDINDGKEFERKIKIENNIRNEIDNNKFFLEYQPIVDAKSQKIVGAEVLSRMNSETDGIVTPGKFISALNNVGLNGKFDFYIFEKNCKWISNNKEKRENYVYTINFSRNTLCDECFVEKITDTVEKYGLKYSCIAIEILEDRDLANYEKELISEKLFALKEKGVKILLDDFGGGYTSFGDLASFDVSIVKIDKSITQNATEKNGFLIMKNIIHTAKDLGFQTLCEGVETEEHRRICVEAGCDMLQGFYFYRPMPVTVFEDLISLK